MQTVVNDNTVSWVSEAWNRSSAGADLQVSVLEVPFDYAVSHRPGTRFGPASIIKCLKGLSLYCTDKRTDLGGIEIIHASPVRVSHDLQQTYQRITEAVRCIPTASIPIVLGGDHSITDPILRGMQDREHKKLGMLVFDAHLDSRDPVVGEEHSGHWMKTIEDFIDYSRVVQVGINAPIYGEHYMRAAEQKGVKIITPYESRRGGSRWLFDTVCGHLRDCDGLYISVDIDCFDQAYAPGTSVPNASGLAPHEVLDLIFEIVSHFGAIGLDVTEVNPLLDRDETTSQLAAQVVMNFLAGLRANKRR